MIEFIIKLFTADFTNWMPLGNFNYGGTDYIVFCRGNKNTGELFFKVKNVNYRFMHCNNPVLPNNLLDVKENWDKIINELNS